MHLDFTESVSAMFKKTKTETNQQDLRTQQAHSKLADQMMDFKPILHDSAQKIVDYGASITRMKK